MERDFIKVRKSDSSDEYNIEIYFAFIDGTVNVQLNEQDFIRFLHESVRLINAHSDHFTLSVPEEVSRLVSKKEEARLRTLAATLRKSASEKKWKDVVHIYISDEVVPLRIAEEITNAAGDFMESMGFEMESEDKPVFSSFLKKLKFIFSRTIAKEDLEKLYQKGKKALELKYVELPTAEQTEKLATAAEKLVKSLEQVDEGVVRCGALLVIKKLVNNKPTLLVQQLSPEMIMILDQRPRLIQSVQTMYELVTGDIKPQPENEDNQSPVTH